MEDWKAKYDALVLQLNNDSGQGIYPQGHLTNTDYERLKSESKDAYQTGWNDAVMDRSKRMREIMESANSGVSDDVTMLLASGMCSLYDDNSILLNMNDTWAWAEAWNPAVPVGEIGEVARLFKLYGNAGLMYWHSCKENNMRSEFHDNNRAIDFVRREEEIRKEVSDYNKRAYHKVKYTIGEE